MDYTLTVAVSIAAGAAALTSAFPGLSSATVPICLVVLAVITLLNLRGLGDAARAFLLPTMVFIVGLLAILAIGLFHPLAPHAAPLGRSLLPAGAMEPVGLLLLLKAFSAGCSALTGVEAIADGVPLFKPPRAGRAKRTELLLGVILGAMLLGVATLAGRWRVAPSPGQTVLSQVMTIAVGRDWAYYAMSLTIMAVLALAANTSFGGLPVLASLLARNNYLPHLYALRNDRQVYTCGIWTLAILSGTLLVAVGGNTLTLDPAVRHRRLHRLHLVAGRPGRALAAHPATALAIPREPQRPRRGRHCRGHRRIPGDEVHRGRLGCGAGVARVHHAVHQDPPLLRPGRARPRHRRNPRQAPGQADRGRGARDRGVEHKFRTGDPIGFSPERDGIKCRESRKLLS